jgi:hypothetical protein
MVDTAQTIINDALLELTVQEGEQAIESFEFQRGVRYLNRMMAEFYADGIDLGYTTVSAPNDIITIPAGGMSALVSNLAIRLSSALDIAITPALQDTAMRGMKTLRKLGINPGKMNFPGNLPIGSGNEYSSETYTGQHFFDDCCEDQNEC